jgi:hypothetical protein
VINPSQTPLPDNTQHSQQTNIHATGGIRIHNLSRRAAEDLRLRTRGHWERQNDGIVGAISKYEYLLNPETKRPFGKSSRKWIINHRADLKHFGRVYVVLIITVEDFRQHGHEPSCFIGGGKFVD